MISELKQSFVNWRHSRRELNAERVRKLQAFALRCGKIFNPSTLFHYYFFTITFSLFRLASLGQATPWLYIARLENPYFTATFRFQNANICSCFFRYFSRFFANVRQRISPIPLHFFCNRVIIGVWSKKRGKTSFKSAWPLRVRRCLHSGHLWCPILA